MIELQLWRFKTKIRVHGFKWHKMVHHFCQFNVKSKVLSSYSTSWLWYFPTSPMLFTQWALYWGVFKAVILRLFLFCLSGRRVAELEMHLILSQVRVQSLQRSNRRGVPSSCDIHCPRRREFTHLTVEIVVVCFSCLISVVRFEKKPGAGSLPPSA